MLDCPQVAGVAGEGRVGGELLKLLEVQILHRVNVDTKQGRCDGQTVPSSKVF